VTRPGPDRAAVPYPATSKENAQDGKGALARDVLGTHLIVLTERPGNVTLRVWISLRGAGFPWHRTSPGLSVSLRVPRHAKSARASSFTSGAGQSRADPEVRRIEQGGFVHRSCVSAQGPVLAECVRECPHCGQCIRCGAAQDQDGTVRLAQVKEEARGVCVPGDTERDGQSRPGPARRQPAVHDERGTRGTVAEADTGPSWSGPEPADASAYDGTWLRCPSRCRHRRRRHRACRRRPSRPHPRRSPGRRSPAAGRAGR
jgi:hypothetical protein